MLRKLICLAFLPILLAAPGSARVAAGDALVQPLFAPDQGETRAVLVLRNGKVIARHYAPSYGDANRFISWSMAKTVTALLVGELVADGRLSLDAPVPFAEWQRPGDPRAAITLRQMLHMSSGLRHAETGDPVQNSDTNQALFVSGTQAMAAYALRKPLAHRPGSHYEYSSLTTLLLSELITRTLTASRDPRVRASAYKAFAEERLFRPAGISTAVLEFDGAGTQIGGSILHMGLDDWGRLGNLMIDGRGPDGSQVIAPVWLAFMRTPAPTDAGYGGHVWLNHPRPVGRDAALFPGQGPDTLFAALGHLGQYVIVMPDQRTVIVRLGKTQDDALDPVRRALGALAAQLGAAPPPVAS